MTVCPVILVLGPRRHDGTALLCAELGDGAVQHVDLIEEVDSCKRETQLAVETIFEKKVSKNGIY